MPGAAAATAELKLVVYGPLRDALVSARAACAGQGNISVHLAVQVDDILGSVVADSPKLALLTSTALWSAALGALLHGPSLATAPEKVTARSNDRRLLQHARSLFGPIVRGTDSSVRRLG